jgi:hypothetical protein
MFSVWCSRRVTSLAVLRSVSTRPRRESMGIRSFSSACHRRFLWRDVISTHHTSLRHGNLLASFSSPGVARHPRTERTRRCRRVIPTLRPAFLRRAGSGSTCADRVCDRRFSPCCGSPPLHTRGRRRTRSTSNLNIPSEASMFLALIPASWLSPTTAGLSLRRVPPTGRCHTTSSAISSTSVATSPSACASENLRTTAAFGCSATTTSARSTAHRGHRAR